MLFKDVCFMCFEGIKIETLTGESDTGQRYIYLHLFTFVHLHSQVFHNCSCVLSPSPAGGSMSVTLGQCPRGPECSRSFTSYMAVSVLSSFINSLGTTPAYMVIIRSVKQQLLLSVENDFISAFQFCNNESMDLL